KMSLPLRVFIIDDHQMFGEGVRQRLEKEADIAVIGEASSGKEALEKLGTLSPTVVILDIRLQDMSGIELAKRLRAKWPEVRILMLTGYDFDQYVRALMRLGIDGYLLKDAPQDTLVEALRAIAKGGVVLPPDIASKVMKSYSSSHGANGSDANPVWDLTMRELDVLELLYQGLRNADMARRLSISVRTVEVHVRNVMSKLGAENRTDAVRIAQEKGILS
ncbi:MAG: response regulator transcription factor, partial [Chloroflexi bacterium]|nr:response regulator transcription factor [Chloroflexota bacterium]